jgi:hypothetical protein
MDPFDDSMTDEVFLVKRDGGARLGPYRTALGRDKCLIHDKTLDIEPGDVIARPLPNGKEEHYTVLRADFINDFHSLPGGYNIILRKEQQIHRAPPSTVQNVTINNSSGVQVGDHNVQNIQNAFAALSNAIEAQNAPPQVKADAKSKLLALLRHPLVVAIIGGAVDAAAD